MRRITVTPGYDLEDLGLSFQVAGTVLGGLGVVLFVTHYPLEALTYCFLSAAAACGMTWLVLVEKARANHPHNAPLWAGRPRWMEHLLRKVGKSLLAASVTGLISLIILGFALDVSDSALVNSLGGAVSLFLVALTLLAADDTPGRARLLKLCEDVLKLMRFESESSSA